MASGFSVICVELTALRLLGVLHTLPMLAKYNTVFDRCQVVILPPLRARSDADLHELFILGSSSYPSVGYRSRKDLGSRQANQGIGR